MRRLSAYRVFLTHNTEYHVRAHCCFGVRDRRSGAWLGAHWALGQRLADAFPDHTGKMCSIRSPAIGEPLWFVAAAGHHRTSPLLAIEDRECFEMPGLHPGLRALALRGAKTRDTY
jgi:hypothetical protein